MLRRYAARALNPKMFTLVRMGRIDEAKATFDEMAHDLGEDALAEFDDQIERSRGSDTPRARAQLAVALYSKALILRDRGRGQEASRVLRELAASFKDSVEPSIKPILQSGAAIDAELEQSDRPA